MNRIDKLIAQHCPNGVEYRELHEVFEIKEGSPDSKSTVNYLNGRTVPWFQLKDIRKSGAILSESIKKIPEESKGNNQLFPANSIIISISGNSVKHALITVPCLASQMFVSLSLKPEFSRQVDMRFANYYCFVLANKCKELSDSNAGFSDDMTGFKKVKFAIPPLPVQQEIVRILDSFTKLEEDLEAELEVRRKQYEYYLNTLLSFDEFDTDASSPALSNQESTNMKS